ncbi:MAG: ATP-binding protein [Oscillospiraceae bacterium]|jgi:signal transduction histidine kinase|nr:ATP-binding protein [Oscillospiraceae bacterium]
MMTELSLNVLDVAQNSVKAGASLIQLGAVREGKWLTLTVEDNGCGMTEEQVAHVTDPFFTTRTTRKVGLGVPFFKMAAEMTGGDFSIASQVGVGTKTTAKFDTAHIDCIPLGDMCSTVVSLIQCNPDRDFVYRYEIDGRGFVLDTREMREELGDVPLDTPEVVEFIREFITEHTNGVDGQAE